MMTGRFFVGARKPQEVAEIVSNTLALHGFRPGSTAVAASFCPFQHRSPQHGDLLASMTTTWGSARQLGGIAGFPFCGRSGWRAFSRTVARNEDILLVYGSNIDISPLGEIGVDPTNPVVNAFNIVDAAAGIDFATPKLPCLQSSSAHTTSS